MNDPHYPRGKIHPDDQGELGIRIGVDEKTSTVIVAFGKPITWIGFSPTDARNVAGMLGKAADNAEGVIVHVLYHGLPLCGFTTAVPGEWPKGMRWLSIEECELATCPGCVSRAVALRAR